MPRGDGTGPRSFKSMRYIQESLVQRGYPVKFRDNLGKTLRLGPLTVSGTTMTHMDTVRKAHGSTFLAATPGTATALVLNARSLPGENPKSAQVVMNLESLIQIMEWLAESNPDSFLRNTKRRSSE